MDYFMIISFNHKAKKKQNNIYKQMNRPFKTLGEL